MSSQEISGPFKVRNNRSELGDELAIVNGNLSFTGVSKSIVLDSFTNSSNLTFNKGKGNYSLNPSISVNSINIANTPINDTHAATVGYVKQFVQGLDAKESVKCATTGNITLSGLQDTVDGINLASGDRVLVKDQTNKAQNGIYLAKAGAWERAADFDAPAEVQGAFVFVEQGSQNAAKGFVQVSAAPVTIGSGDLTFTQFNGTNPAINDLINGKLASNATDFSGNAATASAAKPNSDLEIAINSKLASNATDFSGNAATASAAKPNSALESAINGKLASNATEFGGDAATASAAKPNSDLEIAINSKLASNATDFSGNAATASAAKPNSALESAINGKLASNATDFSGNAATASAAKPNSDLEITLNAKLNKSVFDTSFSTITISNVTPTADTGVTGKIVFNTTNNILYIYTGSAWQSVVAPQA